MVKVQGLINQKITIVSYQDTDDGAGGSFPQEVTYWETSSTVRPIRAYRTLQSDSQEALKPEFEFKVRFRTDKFITFDMRIKWRNQYFTIYDSKVDFVYKEFLILRATAKDLPVR